MNTKLSTGRPWIVIVVLLLCGESGISADGRTDGPGLSARGSGLTWSVGNNQERPSRLRFYPEARRMVRQPGEWVAVGGLESLLLGGKEARLPAAPESAPRGFPAWSRFLAFGFASVLAVWAAAVVVAVYLIGRWQNSRRDDQRPGTFTVGIEARSSSELGVVYPYYCHNLTRHLYRG